MNDSQTNSTLQQVKDGGPAFPVAENHKIASDLDWTCGMSLRDYFAAKAMQGSMANPDHADATGITDEQHASIAKYAYRVADAMLKARAAS